jgi:hypothetical protein
MSKIEEPEPNHDRKWTRETIARLEFRATKSMVTKRIRYVMTNMHGTKKNKGKKGSEGGTPLDRSSNGEHTAESNNSDKSFDTDGSMDCGHFV